MNDEHLKLLGCEVVQLYLQLIPDFFYKEVERTALICDLF